MVNLEFPLSQVQLGLGSFVYKIFNRLNNKLYYGSSTNVTSRWRCHLSDLKNNKHHSRYLQNSFNLHGVGNFSFALVEAVTAELLLMREQKWLDSSLSYLPEFGYNICAKAGSCLGVPMANSTKIKIAEANATKLDATKVLIIKKRLLKGERPGSIASDFNVSTCHIQQIKFGNSWKHIIVEGDYNFGVAGENNPSAKLTEDNVRLMRSMFGKMRVKDIAAYFNISIPTVEAIKYGKTWKGVK